MDAKILNDFLGDPPAVDGGQLASATVTDEAPAWLKEKRRLLAIRRAPGKAEAYADRKLEGLHKDSIRLAGGREAVRERLIREYNRDDPKYYNRDLVKWVEREHPRGGRSRVDYLESLPRALQEVMSRDPRYRTGVWHDAGQAIVNARANDPERIRNTENDPWLTEAEKERRIARIKQSPLATQVTDALGILGPTEIPAKVVQSAYRDDTTVAHALSGGSNGASLAEDILTDPSIYLGLGFGYKSLKGGANAAVKVSMPGEGKLARSAVANEAYGLSKDAKILAGPAGVADEVAGASRRPKRWNPTRDTPGALDEADVPAPVDHRREAFENKFAKLSEQQKERALWVREKISQGLDESEINIYSNTPAARKTYDGLLDQMAERKADFLSPEGQKRLGASPTELKGEDLLDRFSAKAPHAYYSRNEGINMARYSREPQFQSRSSTLDHEIHHAAQYSKHLDGYNRETADFHQLERNLNFLVRGAREKKASFGPRRREDFQTAHDRDYFLDGSKGKETGAFVSELRRDMIEAGDINHVYDDITEDHLFKARERDRLRDPRGHERQRAMRILDIDNEDIRKATLELINKIPAVSAGATVAGAAAEAVAGEGEGSVPELARGGFIDEAVTPQMSPATMSPSAAGGLPAGDPPADDPPADDPPADDPPADDPPSWAVERSDRRPSTFTPPPGYPYTFMKKFGRSVYDPGPVGTNQYKNSGKPAIKSAYKSIHLNELVNGNCLAGSLYCNSEIAYSNNLTPVRQLVEDAKVDPRDPRYAVPSVKPDSELQAHPNFDQFLGTRPGNYEGLDRSWMFAVNNSIDAWEMRDILVGEGLGADVTADVQTRLSEGKGHGLPVGTIIFQDGAERHYTDPAAGSKNRHAMTIAGFDENGEALVYDYGELKTWTEIQRGYTKRGSKLSYVVPSGYEDLTYDKTAAAMADGGPRARFLDYGAGASSVKPTGNPEVDAVVAGITERYGEIGDAFGIPRSEMDSLVERLIGIGVQESSLGGHYDNPFGSWKGRVEYRIGDTRFGNAVLKPVAKAAADLLDGPDSDPGDAKPDWEVEMRAYGIAEETGRDFVEVYRELRDVIPEPDSAPDYESSVGAFAVKGVHPVTAERYGFSGAEMMGSSREAMIASGLAGLTKLAQNYRSARERYPGLTADEILDLATVGYNNASKFKSDSFTNFYIRDQKRPDDYLSKVRYNQAQLFGSDREVYNPLLKKRVPVGPVGTNRAPRLAHGGSINSN